MVNDLPAWAEPYIGIPFAEKGAAADGANCWGFVCLYYRNERGVMLPTHCEQYATADDYRAIADLIRGEISDQHWQQIPREQAAVGDVVLLRIYGQPAHVGICATRRVFLHILRGANSAAQRFDSMLWRDRILGFYRYQSMSESGSA